MVVQQIAATFVKILVGSEGLTVLLSEQNVRFATHVADRAAVIERGRVLVAGPMAADRARMHAVAGRLSDALSSGASESRKKH